MRRLRFPLAVLLVLALLAPARAATQVWTGTASSVFLTAGNWASGVAPVNNDTVYIPATSSVNITGAATGLTGINLIVDAGYSGTIGSAATYLKIVCASFSFAGGGVSYIDVDTSAITLSVNGTASGSATAAGLYLKGSAIATLAVSGGNVGLAFNDGETATVTTTRVAGGGTRVTLGSGVTATTASVSSGTLILNCAATTANLYNGTLQTGGTGAITTINSYAGALLPYSTGTVTTLNILGGSANFMGSATPRTVTNLKLNAGGALRYDPAILTITTKVNPDAPVLLNASPG